jgi:hypothetical protein
VHESRSLACVEVGHFPDMGVPDGAAKAGIAGFLHADHAALPVTPQHFAAITIAQLARHKRILNDE